jgi:Putative lumazine-binding
VVHLYIDGFGAHRPEMFEQAFHSAARIYWTDAEGAFREALILNPDNDPDDPESWPNLDQWHVTGRIISVIQAGDVASVVLGFDNNDDRAQSWVDIHTLLRVDGSWKIMAKTATHASRADWAGLGVSRQPEPPTD